MLTPMSRNHTAEKLSELFGQSVDTELIEQRQQPGAELSICEMSYSRDSESGRVRQTVLLLKAESFDLPQFTLQPENSIGRLLAGLTGFEDIDFADDPAFSDAYFLHGWATEAVSVLFTRSMRNWFASHPGWSVHGKGNCLAVFRFRNHCPPDDIDRFIGDCMPILPLFLDGAQKLDSRPDLSRHATPREVAETVAGMGGLIGWSLQKQLATIRLTRQELQEFLSTPAPRPIPPGMKRQVLGDNAALIPIGGVFVLAGLGSGLATFLSSDDSTKTIGLLFLFLFPLIGGLLSGLTIRHRMRKRRLLREGILCQGQIEDIRQSSVIVNGQLRFHIRILYSTEGREQTAQCNACGPAVDIARALQKSGDSARILVDPRDVNHHLCLDLLSITE